MILTPVFRVSARVLTSLTAFGSRGQSEMSEVMHQHEKLASILAYVTGFWIWIMCHQTLN